MGLYDATDIQIEGNGTCVSKLNSKCRASHFYDISNSNIQKINNCKKKYGEGKEAAMIRDEMGGFDPMSSEAMQFLKINFGNSLRLSELKGIINAVREYFSSKGVFLPKLSRNANRNYQLCVKYVQDNFELMKRIIPYVRLCDGQGNIIPIHEF